MKFESKIFLWILVHLCLIIGGDNCVFKSTYSLHVEVLFVF